MPFNYVFFFFFLGPVCISSGSTSAFKAYCAYVTYGHDITCIARSLPHPPTIVAEKIKGCDDRYTTSK
jgi:hypothetical protein